MIRLHHAVYVVVPVLLSNAGCTTISHATQPSALGNPIAARPMLERLDEPGPLTVETVVSATLIEPREVVIDLNNPRCHQADLGAGDEPIQILFHVVKHPDRGTFLIDTGLVKTPAAGAAEIGPGGVRLDAAVRVTPLADWRAANGGTIEGVFFTDLHSDHVSGLRDLPVEVPIYVGAGELQGETARPQPDHASAERALEGHPPISQWQFEGDQFSRFAGLVDVFGDGSLFAISVPGHTRGSTAYLARTTTGPVLFTGDTAATRWGWAHTVEGGTASDDRPRNAESLRVLRDLVKEHPSIEVRLGHQPATETAAPAKTP